MTPRQAPPRLSGDGVLRPGQSLVTRDGERVRLQVADIGRVDLEPGSTLRLVRSGVGEHRIALDRGRIDAFVVAPPRLSPWTSAARTSWTWRTTARAGCA